MKTTFWLENIEYTKEPFVSEAKIRDVSNTMLKFKSGVGKLLNGMYIIVSITINIIKGGMLAR